MAETVHIKSLYSLDLQIIVYMYAALRLLHLWNVVEVPQSLNYMKASAVVFKAMVRPFILSCLVYVVFQLMIRLIVE